MLCPNINNRQVLSEFNEIVLALGGEALSVDEFKNSDLRQLREGLDYAAMEAAYKIWHRSNGNGLELAPNGASSKLFQDLLDLNGGNRLAAIIAKAKVYSDEFINWFGDWINDPANASKVVDENGEPLVVYHGGSNTQVFDTSGKRRGGAGIKKGIKGSYFTTSKRNAKSYEDIYAFKTGEMWIAYTDQLRENGATDEEIKQLDEQWENEKPATRPFFLSIKNPIETEYHGNDKDGYSETSNSPENADGQHIKIETRNYEEYVATNPNQIKSATDNVGSFSTEDNNIYHNLISSKIENAEDLKNTFLNILTQYYDFHNWNFTRITQNKKLKAQYEDQINQILTAFGFPTGTMCITDSGKVVFNDRLVNNHIDLFKDLINNHEKIKDLSTILSLVLSMQSKFAGIKKIQFRTGTDYNAKFENGVIYINPNRVTSDTLFEECLHPFVEALYNENPELFNKLLQEARKDFPKLRAQIAVDYKGNKFTAQDRYKELVTQALSRHYADIHNKEDQKSIWRKAFDWIINRLNVGRLFELGSNITLGQLALAIYAADNINIDLKYYNNTMFSLNSQVGSVSNILGNNKFEDIKQSLSQSGIVDDDYAMRTALYESRIEYINSEESKFTEQYIENLRNKVKPNGFFKKVIAFFKSPWNKNIIEDPSKKDKEKVRVLAKQEFDQTVYHTLVQSIVDGFRTFNTPGLNKLADTISKLHDAGNKIIINDILAMIDVVLDNSNIIFNNESDVLRVINVLKELDFALYHDGIRLFKNVKTIAEAIITGDCTGFTLEQIDYIQNFKMNVHTLIENDLNDSNALKNHRTMFFQLDESLRCPNEEAYNAIKSGLESRLISISRGTMSTSKNVAYNIKSRISKLKLMNMYDVADMYKVYMDFLDQAEIELDAAISYFQDCSNNQKIINAERLMYFKKDVFGYYDYIIKNFINSLSNENGLTQQLIDEIKDILTNTLNDKMAQAEREYTKANEVFVNKVVEDYCENHMLLGNLAAYKRYMKEYLRNKINNGAVELVGNVLGDANSSKSPVVRMIANMLNNDEREVHRLTYTKSRRLITLYKKCESVVSKMGNPSNYMKNFVEIDDEGRPTGNFIRSINYGQFEKNMKLFEAKLRKKYGLSVDERGNTVFHWDLSGTEDVYNKYHDELDDWLERNCNRRYTAEYYKQRRRYITYNVRLVLNPLNEQIELLQKKCTVDGNVYVNKLSLNERRLLKQLLEQKQEISNPYTVQYDTNGKNIVSLQLKEGEELEIAEKIQEWNKLRYKHIKRNNSRQKYEEALAQITDPVERAVFEHENLSTMIDPEFYELLQQCSTSTQTEEYLKLAARRNKLLGSTKEDGQYTPNLLRMNDDAWDEMHDLEQEMEDNRTKGTKGNIDFDDIAEKRQIMIQDPNNPLSQISVLNYIKRQYQQRMMTDPNAMNDFYNRFYVKTVDNRGRDILKPLNAFYEVVPKDSKYITQLPVGPYVEYDSENSDWINKRYNEEDTEMYQPHEPIYKNKKYDKIMSDKSAKAFYDYIIETMEESIALLPPDQNVSKYKMPQVTDSTMSLLSRNIMSMHFSDILKPFGQLITITENDTEFYREDRSRRPDGTLVESIPLRYIKDLDDKSKVSCDIVNTVSLFYQMALNYDRKSKTVPVAESMIQEMYRYAGKTTGQIELASTELEMYGYGKMQKGLGEESKKMTGSEAFWTKMINNHRRLAQLAMLGGNVYSATKGAISAQWQVLVGGIIGKYYAKDDLTFAYTTVFRGMFSAISNLGSSKPGNLLQALMLKDGAARTMEDIAGNKHISRLRRLLKFFSMGLFTVGDYTSNALITAAVYHATRLVEDPVYNGTYSFMTKTQYIDRCRKAGISIKTAKRNFRRSRGNNLFNMYEMDENNTAVLKKSVKISINGKKFTINPADYVRPDGKTNIEDRIAGTIESRASIANGVVAEHGKGKIYQNTFSKLAMVMRGFLVAQGYDRFKTGNDFEGDVQYKGQYNFETGEVERGTINASFDVLKYTLNFVDRLHDLSIMLPGIQKYIKDKQSRNTLTREDTMAIKQTLGDVIGVAMFLGLCVYIFIPESRKYPDSWFLAFMRLVTAGCAIETATMLNPNTGLDLLTSVTVVKSWVDDYLSLFGALKLIANPGKLTDPISSSAYKNKPRWFRYLMKGFLKPTGITGYYETFTPAISGLDKESSKYQQILQEHLQNIQNRPWLDSFSNVTSNLYDLYQAFTTPYGMDSKYDYYNKKVSPATWLPSRKDDNEPSSSSSSSSEFGGFKGGFGKGFGKGF